MGVVDRDFYEWETHIFFDDAFELGDNDEEQQVSWAFINDVTRILTPVVYISQKVLTSGKGLVIGPIKLRPKPMTPNGLCILTSIPKIS